MGDIVALYNSAGSVYGVYHYDAYGKLLSITSNTGTAITAPNHPAILNPLRYRGYVHDAETGLYYLQSRYYDPETCRFVNADSQLNTDSFNGFNQFAYCGNNPIHRKDILGTSWLTSFFDLVEQIITQIRFMVCKENASPEKEELKNNPPALTNTGNNELTYSSESDASVIARMLYGEDSESAEAHLWMLQNRLDSGDNYGGSDFRELILSPNQFSAMTGDRALNPALHFGGYGEQETWSHCVDVAYAYIYGGIDVIPKPSKNFNYTYTHSFSDTIKEEYPNGVLIGGTWFYSP